MATYAEKKARAARLADLKDKYTVILRDTVRSAKFLLYVKIMKVGDNSRSFIVLRPYVADTGRAMIEDVTAAVAHVTGRAWNDRTGYITTRDGNYARDVIEQLSRELYTDPARIEVIHLD